MFQITKIIKIYFLNIIACNKQHQSQESDIGKTIDLVIADGHSKNPLYIKNLILFCPKDQICLGAKS